MTAWRSRRTKLRRAVRLISHKDERYARRLTAAAYPSGLGTRRGILAARYGNGVVSAAWYGKYRRTSSRNPARNRGLAVAAFYLNAEIACGERTGDKIVLNGHGYPAFIVFTAFLTGIAAHNIQSFRSSVLHG